jgi:putative ABC transport system permease protein
MLVLILSAFALAMVVLYNLTNININERIRERATIKVLGFYDMEVSTYVFRENAIITILGAGFGLVLGTLLHSFVVQTAEIDMIMFGRNIAPVSFLISFALTVLFSLLVNVIMHFYLRKISMVESLKSTE